MTNSAGRHILGMRVDATSYDDATRAVIAWAQRGESRYVCAANVHMVMEAYDDPAFQRVVNGAALVTPDGMPLAWTLRALGARGQQRVYGPDLTLAVCRAAAEAGVPVGFYGGRPERLNVLIDRLVAQCPGLNVAYQHAPPFRAPTEAEAAATVEAINASGTRIVMVGLGCPKQERWMAAQQGRVRAVMLGVGAAFDFHAGQVRQAPRWVMRLGLEWLFRLAVEPRRLWRRYLKHNPRYVVLTAMQLCRLRRFGKVTKRQGDKVTR